jgi:predicted phosphodiesterase
MRYLVLSDMHANWPAFDLVLRSFPVDGYDRVLVLGDLVGYGARPNEVVEAVRALPSDTVVIRGNHDKVASGIESAEFFNPAARMAAEWTQRVLSEENLRYVRELPRGPVAIDEELLVCHGTPHDEDIYVLSADEAMDCFESSEARVILFGHTHVTCAFSIDSREMTVQWGMGDGDSLELAAGRRYLINPGSVGQPRDGDPRAAFLTLDTTARRAVWHRLDYPIGTAQDQIRAADLPPFLAERLAEGM